jgi:hypothetical protein
LAWFEFRPVFLSAGRRQKHHGLSVVRLLDLDWGAHIEFPVKKALMVPPPHVFEGREFDLLNRPPGALLSDQFGLVEVVEYLVF